MDEVYNQMLTTASIAGLHVISADKCAKLLALCYAFGDENFVFNEKLTADVLYAARTFGLKGGCVPDKEASAKIALFFNQIRMDGKPDWVSDIEQEYRVEFPRWEENDVCIPESINRQARRR